MTGRRLLTVALAILASAMAFAVTSAGAMSTQAGAAAAATYTDPAGDSGAASDITTVTVSDVAEVIFRAR